MSSTKGKRASPQRSAVGSTDWVDGNLHLLGVERPDLDLSGSEITARIFRLRELFVQRLDELHSQFGLKPRMFLVLAALYRSGPPYQLSPAKLLRHLMWTSGGLSQLLDRMEASRLIRRQKGPRTRRGVAVILLPKGRRIISTVLHVHCNTELRLVSPLAPAEQRELASLLRKLLVGVEGAHVVSDSHG